VQFAAERWGNFENVFSGAASVYEADSVDLFLLVDPGALTVSAFIARVVMVWIGAARGGGVAFEGKLYVMPSTRSTAAGNGSTGCSRACIVAAPPCWPTVCTLPPATSSRVVEPRAIRTSCCRSRHEL